MVTRQSSCWKLQETYCLCCNLSKHNLLGVEERVYLTLTWMGGDIPTCPGQGVSHPALDRGHTPSCHGRGIPPGTGVPSPRKDTGPMEEKGHRTSRSIMRWRWCTPWNVHGTHGSIMGWRWTLPSPSF